MEFNIDKVYSTHCGFVTPYGDIDLGQHCLMAPSHYLDRCWFIIKGVLCHSPESNFIGIDYEIDLQNEIGNYTFKIISTSPRIQWVNTTTYRLLSYKFCVKKLWLVLINTAMSNYTFLLWIVSRHHSQPHVISCQCSYLHNYSCLPSHDDSVAVDNIPIINFVRWKCLMMTERFLLTSAPWKVLTHCGVEYHNHYTGVIMGAMASQITSLTSVYSTVYSGADQRKYQRSTPLAFVQGIHQWLVNSPHKRPVTGKMFPFDDIIMLNYEA